MESPTGRVLSVQVLDEDQSLATVEVDAAPPCPRCAAGKGCGAGIFAGRGPWRVDAVVPPAVEIRPGDVVTIDLAGPGLLPAALIVYGWPLAGAITGAMLALAGPWVGDASIAAGAFAGLVVAGLLAGRRLRARDCVSRFRPVIVRQAGAQTAI